MKYIPQTILLIDKGEQLLHDSQNILLDNLNRHLHTLSLQITNVVLVTKCTINSGFLTS